MRRNAFIVPPENIRASFVEIHDKNQVHQIRRVLRMHEGDAFLVLDGKGNEHECLVHELGKGLVRGQITATHKIDRETRIPMTLYPAIIRRERFAEILEKCSELGASAFVPVLADRSPYTSMSATLIERWNRVIREATEVVRRGILPALLPAQPLKIAIEQALQDPHALTLVLSTHSETTHSPRDLVEMVQGTGVTHINIFLGPEGGYSAEELQLFDDAGIESVTLGPRKVRSETAAIAVTSIIAGLL
jgi:16S rRNA (uracil1498-N3)-methyltransferase